VLFQVFGPVGRIRRRSGGLDHRISVVVVVVIGGRGIVSSGSRYGGITASGVGISTGTTTAVGAGGDGGSSASAVDGGGGGGGSGDGGGGAFEAFGVGDTFTVVVVDVGYDYGVGGAIGSIAVGPPEHSQHNIHATECRDFSAAATNKWSTAVYGHPPSVNETSTKPSDDGLV